MPHNSFNPKRVFSPFPTSQGGKGGWGNLVRYAPPSIYIVPLLVLVATSACGGGERPKVDYSPPPPFVAPAKAKADGAIFNVSSYAPLTSGSRATRVGDIITVVLAENTTATKSNSATTNRSGSIGLTPPTTGPLSLFSPTDVNASGDQSFNGQGAASQSNALSGTITVAVTQVLPNGVMRVSGEKLLNLNRGDERIRLTGLIRVADVSPDNNVLSTRIADARIAYFGKGEIARASKQGWLQRFFSVISPF